MSNTILVDGIPVSAEEYVLLTQRPDVKLICMSPSTYRTQKVPTVFTAETTTTATPLATPAVYILKGMNDSSTADIVEVQPESTAAAAAAVASTVAILSPAEGSNEISPAVLTTDTSSTAVSETAPSA